MTIYVMLCVIWYRLCNFKNVKNTHGGVLLLKTLQASAKKKIYIKGAVMKIEKAEINDRLPVSKVSLKFRIPTINNFSVIYP